MAHLPDPVDELKRKHESLVIFRSGSMREPLGDREVVCEKHGAYTTSGTRYMGKHEIWTRCPDCEEERIAAERQAEADHKAAQAQAALEAAIGNAAIPARFIGRSFDNFKADTDAQRHALTVARDYAEGFDRNFQTGASLIFSGMPGTGKSHLATAILQAIMPRHVGLYLTCMSLIRSVRDTWRRDSDRSETEVLAMLCAVPLLVIDEIGVQYGTEGEQTLLFEVIDRRYRDMKPTILLTNQDKKGFREYIGDRTFDRLVETGRWVPFDWESYRPIARREAANA